MMWLRLKSTAPSVAMMIASLCAGSCSPAVDVPPVARDAGNTALSTSSASASKKAPPQKNEATAAATTSAAVSTSEPKVPIAKVEETPPVRLPTDWSSSTTNGVKRIEEAKAAKLEVVKGLFEKAKVAFPPGQILLRGFKKEKRVEIWAATAAAGPLTHVTTYEICYASGDLGPKRKEGDRQVPEGFYSVNLYNPASSYYLGFQINYPNKSDRVLGDKLKPGSEIMLHGNCVSIGCMAMSDERAQEIWLAATSVRDRGGTVHFHIFPTRDMAGLIATTDQKQHVPFWENVKEGYDYFQQKKVIPTVAVETDGRYRFRDPL